MNLPLDSPILKTIALDCQFISQFNNTIEIIVLYLQRNANLDDSLPRIQKF